MRKCEKEINQFVSVRVVNVAEREERSLRSSDDEFFRLIPNHSDDRVRLKFKETFELVKLKLLIQFKVAVLEII